MSPLYVMIKKMLSSDTSPQNPGPPAHLLPLPGPNSPPHPPPQAHMDPRYAPAPHNPWSAPYGPPQAHPNMTYAPPPPQTQPAPWILLGFQPSISGAQHAVYGPPGAEFDSAGNIFIPHEGGSKEYITPYRGYNGKARDPPTPEEDCCGFWHWVGVRTDHHWMTTRDWGQGVGVVR